MDLTDAEPPATLRRCDACGKSVSPRATLRPLDGRMMCSPCFRQRSEIEERRNSPATEPRRRFADELGLRLSDQATLEEAQAIIGQEVEGRRIEQSPEFRKAFAIAVDQLASELSPRDHTVAERDVARQLAVNYDYNNEWPFATTANRL